MNKEVMFCYYHVLLSSGVSAFRKPMHRLWCQRNPSLADVSEQRLADQKRFLLASGKLTESDGKPGSGLSSAMAADHSSGQTSAMDELLVDDSAAMTLGGDSVTPRMTAAEMAPGARGRKPVVSMMQEDHDSADYCKRGNFRVVEIFAIFAVEVFSAKINTTRKFARALPGYHVASARENFHPRNGL